MPVFLLALLWTAPVFAGGVCGDNSPAVPVPECRDAAGGTAVPCEDPGAVRLWPPELRPARPGQVLPAWRDSTQWTSTTIPGASSGHELCHSLDIADDKLYVAYNAGLQVWDLAGDNAEDPLREAFRDGWSGHFLSFPAVGENDFFVDDVAVAISGATPLIALSGRDSVGLTIWSDTGGVLVQHYQDVGNRSQQVRVVEHGGVLYALAAGVLGIFVYDMEQAAALPVPCLDEGGTVCPGIYRGRLGTTNLSLHLDLLPRDGKVWVAKSGGPGVPVEIWELANPAVPAGAVRRFQGLEGRGVALFEAGGVPYLALVEVLGVTSRLRIYDVGSCLDSDGCGAPGAPLFDRPLGAAFSSPQFLTFSADGEGSYLYFGANEFGLEGSRVEILLDLAGLPAGILREITEGGGTYTDACTGNTVDYWGDYYPDNGHGLRNVRPMVGRVHQGYFYRAAYGILDVHEKIEAAEIFSDGFESGDTSAW